MQTFEHRFVVKAPVEEVSAFHFRPDALKLLGPPASRMQMHQFDPLADGSIADFTIWLGGLIPIHWRALHSEVSEEGFIDTQVEGPMKSWVHVHSFRSLDKHKSEVVDSITYEHPAGLAGLWTRLLFSKAALYTMFKGRQMATQREVMKRWLET